MKDFMLLFRFDPASSEAPTPEALALMEKQWGHFIGSVAAGGRLVSTHQLGEELRIVHPESVANLTAEATGTHMIGGNMVLKASSVEEAASLASGCPILLMGGYVEIRDIVPM